MNDSSLLFTRDYTMESDFCFGCGNSHIDTSNRRCMNTTDAGKAVKKIWEVFINDEETNEAMSLDATAGYMCRSCFSAFERLNSLRNSIKVNLRMFLNKVHSSVPDVSESRRKIRKLVLYILTLFIINFN